MAEASAESDGRSVVVVIPTVSEPDWSLFAEIPEEIPIIIVDDSDGQIAPPSRPNVRMFDYAAQRSFMGKNYGAIAHKCAATRNFGHVVAFREGYDVVIALDYDCRPKPGWLTSHLHALREADDHDAVRADWINSVDQPGFYARGFPYERRDSDLPPPEQTTASGMVKLNMGVWNNVLDINGVDKLRAQPPSCPGATGYGTRVALGNVPLCGMNNAFAAEIVPAYFFLPDVFFDGWQLSRHDDIWGGFVLKRLLDLRGDLLSFGAPTVEHTRQSPLEQVVTMEHWMHLMSMPFYEIVETAIASITPGSYKAMFGEFSETFLIAAERSRVPGHFRRVYAELGKAMCGWACCFD